MFFGEGTKQSRGPKAPSVLLQFSIGHRPRWKPVKPIDVLVNALIGCLEKSNAYMRAVGNQVFALLCGSVEETTIDLIIAVRVPSLRHEVSTYLIFPQFSNWEGGELQGTRRLKMRRRKKEKRKMTTTRVAARNRLVTRKTTTVITNQTAKPERSLKNLIVQMASRRLPVILRMARKRMAQKRSSWTMIR